MFNVGDVVQLKSGGVSMTVSDAGDTGVQCNWFTAKGDLKSVGFDPAMLKAAKPPATLEELVIASGEQL